MSRRKCRAGCGRWLTGEESLALGYGPVCAKRAGITRHPARTRPRTVHLDAAPEQIPGQEALPLVDHQPSLWSL